MERMLPKMYKDLLGIVSVLWIELYPAPGSRRRKFVSPGYSTAAILPRRGSRKSCMGISQSIPAMEHRPEQDERMEEMPEAEVLTESGTARAEEATEGMVPESGAMELEQQHTEDVSTATRFTEVLTLPKVDRGAAPATPTIRPRRSLYSYHTCNRYQKQV